MKTIKRVMILRPFQKDNITNSEKQKEQNPEKTIEHNGCSANFTLDKFPWHEVNSGEKRGVLLYLPKDAHEKLKYVSKYTDVPQQRIMRNVLIPEIDRQLEELFERASE